MLRFFFGSRKKNSDGSMTFWGHIDELRIYLFRSVVAVLLFSILAFLYKGFIFDTLIMSPSDTDFITYRVLCKLGKYINTDVLCFDPFTLSLINIELGGQFRYHLLISIISGVIAAFPVFAYQIWMFIKPALKINELRYARGMVFYITGLFFTGVLFGYFVIVPLTVNFLATYELSELLKNQITIGSYISIVSVLTLSMGLVFELPVLVFFLTKIGLLTSAFLRKYRKYAIVIIFIAAGFITPSTDMFSQLLVALPLLFLYEISIIISKKVEAKQEFK